MGNHLGYYHPALIELCNNCKEPDCNGEPCKAYKATETMIRMERRRTPSADEKEEKQDAPEGDGKAPAKWPAIMIEAVIDPDREEALAQKRETLGKYNAAIAALDKLTEDECFSSSPEMGTAVELLGSLRTERRERFEILVDWDKIAKGDRTS